MSIILVTHDLGVIAETCDEVCVMYAGRVVERGDAKEFLPSATRLYAGFAKFHSATQWGSKVAAHYYRWHGAGLE